MGIAKTLYEPSAISSQLSAGLQAAILFDYRWISSAEQIYFTLDPFPGQTIMLEIHTTLGLDFKSSP